MGEKKAIMNVTTVTFMMAFRRQFEEAPPHSRCRENKEWHPKNRSLIREGEMSILLGILLYVLSVAFFCTLTGMNRLDGPEPRARRVRDLVHPEQTVPANSVAAPEAQG
jgi:hypothetical protein